MVAQLSLFIQRFWPGFGQLPTRDQRQWLVELLGLTLVLPLVPLVGIWLASDFDANLLLANGLPLLINLLLYLLAERLAFFQIIEGRGGYGLNEATLSVIPAVAGTFSFGPNWLIVIVLIDLLGLLVQLRGLRGIRRVTTVRSLLTSTIINVFSLRIALLVYGLAGASLPLTGTTANAILAAIAGVLVGNLVLFLWLAGLVLMIVRVGQVLQELPRDNAVVLFFLGGILLPGVFGVFAALVYQQMGGLSYLALMAGVLLVSLLANRLSKAVDASNQRSRELAAIEQLGRAILAAPPDGSQLGPLLASEVPNLLRYYQIEIYLLPDWVVVRQPDDQPGLPPAAWQWLRTQAAGRAFARNVALPWASTPLEQPLALVPIQHVETRIPLGGIAVATSRLDSRPEAILPALQSLAGQIASALFQAEAYERMITYQRTQQELAFAGQVQKSFLPLVLPQVPGWQIAVTLRPARETSGDFYDVLELPGGRLGLLVADVSDKGSGAALFMALSRTLIRTYAFERPEAPDLVLQAANERMLTDASASMFVTVFYGVLDTATGQLTYASAGHNPALWLQHGTRQSHELGRTGVPLGIERLTWRAQSIVLAPGDTLVLYTDGVSEAQDTASALFDMPRLRAAASRQFGHPARVIEQSILNEVDTFVGDAPQYDDITLMVVVRDAQG